MFVIQRARADDLAAVRRLADRVFPEAYADGFFTGLWEAAADTFLLASDRVSGAIVGMGVAARQSQVEARVVLIGTDASVRRQGLGAALLRELERRLRGSGCQRVELEVRPDNVDAMRFYRRRGYEVQGRIPSFYADGSEAVVMVKAL